MKRTLRNILILLVSVIMLSSCATVDRQKTVAVSGTGTVSYEVDTASFNVEISEIKDSTKEAQSAVNFKIGQVLSILDQNGIPEADISTGSISLRSEFEWKDGSQIYLGQRASQSLRITVRDIDVLSTVIDSLGDVPSISINSISFTKNDLSEELKEAKILAVRNAEEKADLYAKQFGMKAGSPLFISEESAYSAGRNYMSDSVVMAESYMKTSIPTGVSQVTMTINIVFELI